MNQPTNHHVLSALALLAASFLLPVAVAAAEVQDSSLTPNDVDAASSMALANGKPQAAESARLLRVLGLLPVGNDSRWTAGDPRTDGKNATYQYLVVFKKPVSFGSLFVFGTPRQIRCLNSGVSWPADLGDSRVWTDLEVPAGQSGGKLVVPPAVSTTQAVLLTDQRSWGASAVEAIRLFKIRWQNITPAALAYASREYYREPADFTPPHLFAASLVASGTGVWQNVGKNKEGKIAAPPVSDVSPEWFMLSWDKRQTISGLWLHGSPTALAFETYEGPDAINPRAGTQVEWKKVRNVKEQVGQGRWISFDRPLSTRGLRINITKAESRNGGAQVAEIDGLHVFCDLGDRPAENLARAQSGPAAPPFDLPYTLPEDANFTLVVNDTNGKRVRNIQARIPAKAGSGSANWDLRDEQGTLVAPGEYRWSAISYPTLQTRYEFSVYPNVNENAPENAAWLTGASGSGGWLSDHCQNTAVCAMGERVFLAAAMAESGVALIECDLAGHKRWGHPSFAAWTGVGHLASDGKTLFNATQILGKTADTVWGVDVETKKVRDVLSLPPSAERKRGLRGIAARDGKLLLSVGAKEDWLAGAVSADDVDLANCYPLYRPARQPRFSHEVVPDPQSDFLRLFRLVETPPGTSNSGAMIYLKSMTDAAKRQHILLAFHRPVPIGSVVLPRPEGKDVQIRLSMLKADAAYPPDMNDARQWIEFPAQPHSVWDVIAAPAGATTRALRLTFIKGEIAPSDDLLAAPDSEGPVKEVGTIAKSAKSDNGLGFGAGTEQWQAQLEGMKLLRRRFENASAAAEVSVNSGQVAADGSWDAERKEPLTASNPGIYMQQWKAPQKIRGLAIKEIDGRLTKIDVYTGPSDRPIDLASAADWQEVGEYEQPRRYYYQPARENTHDARYFDGYVDFGREVETRALRLRIVEQWSDRGDRSLYGVRVDRGGLTLDPTRCRVYGVAAVRHLGGETPVDKKIEQRIEVFNSANGKLEQEIGIDRPGHIAFNSAGDLYAVSGATVVKVDPAEEKHKVIVSDLESPGDLVFDRRGQMYVVDLAPARQNIRVYDSAGKYLRSIGKAGPRSAGPWEPDRLNRVVDIDIDSQDQLWVVEGTYSPKRVTLWSTDGTFKKEFLGNTPYGGGGALDPYDKSRLFCGPLEFELDWKTGHSRLKNLVWAGKGTPGEIPIRVGDRTYLVTRTSFGAECGIVYLYEKDHLKMAAAMGRADLFEPLKPADMIARLGGPALETKKFIWADLNGNGQVEAEEVKLSPKPERMPHLGNFDHDLGVQAGPIRYKVDKFLPSGVPVYVEQEFPGLVGSQIQRLDDGFIRLGADGAPESGLSTTGDMRWTYPSYGTGGHALYKAAKWDPGQVISEFCVIGHEKAQGDLGEFVVLHTNAGDWNVWTADGLLVGPIFRDYRDPQAKPWSMVQHDRGMILEDMTLSQEHFQGYFCRSVADNKFYAVAGHNHVSVVEVLGLDKVKRYSGSVVITASDLKHMQAWQEQHEQTAVYQRAPVIDCYRLSTPPKLDGRLEDWPAASAEMGDTARFHMGYDDSYLYVAYSTDKVGPLKNTGQQWDRLFKTGASVDLQIGMDEGAPIDRRGPVAGDVRLLMTYMDGRPTAVLYRAVASGGPKGQPWRVVSPVGEVSFDEVRQLDDVHMVRSPDKPGGGYIVEAAIPLAALGLKPADGMRLKLDWGILRTGPDGHEVLQRMYWANKATGIIADAPSEARLHPDLWGYCCFHDHNRPSAEDRFQEDFAGTSGKKGKQLAGDLDDLLDSVKDEKK